MAEIAVVSVSVLTGLLGLVGLAVRYVLLPYLKEHLIEPVKETNKQVTVNTHASDSPTVLDRIDDVSQQIRVLARMFDGHLSWSQAEVKRIDKKIDDNRKRGTQ